VLSQRSTAETSVARQRLGETRFRGNEYVGMNRGVARRLSHVFMATENEREQSTVLLGELYSVHMKLVQSEIQRSRERVKRVRDPEREFERLKTLRGPYNSERFVIKGVQCVSCCNQV
jgi:hypothetical protein